MAGVYTINEQPTTIGFCKSPLMYYVDDTNYTADSFEYTASVFITQDSPPVPWTTPNYILRKPPNMTDGGCTWDLSKLVEDFFIEMQYEFPNEFDTQYMNAFMFVKFGYSYVSAGSTVEDLAAATSNQIKVFNGYNYYNEGINFYSNDELANLSGNSFMTDRPLKTNIPLNSSMHLFLYSNYPSGSVDKVRWEVVYDDGAGGTVKTDYTYTLIAPTDIGGTVLAIGAGTNEMKDKSVSNYEPISYKIWGATAGDAIVTYVYEFTVVDACRYGFKNIQFLNRYGVWDNLFMYGSQINSLTTTRNEAMNSPLDVASSSWDFTEQRGQFRMSNVNGREKVTVNSGWVSEDWNPMFKQLMLTDNVYDPDSLQPLTIEKSNLLYKTSVNDGLINYTINFNYGYTATNTVY